jgi:hypothetical protein
MVMVFLILLRAVSNEYSNHFPKGVLNDTGLNRSQEVEVISRVEG